MATNDDVNLREQIAFFLEWEQFGEAEALLLEKLSDKPQNPNLFILQGDVFLAQGRSIEAQIFYEKALEEEESSLLAAEKLKKIQYYINKLHLPPAEIARQIVDGQFPERDLIILLHMIREADHQIELIDQIRHQLTINQDNWYLFWRLALEARQLEQVEAVDDLCNKIQSVRPDFWYAQELPGHVRGYFARADHDEFIEQFFLENPPIAKFFVEIGAFDGEHFSNVRRLYTAYGWHGLCTEPTPEYFRKLAATYQDSEIICLSTPVKDIDGEADFLMPAYPAEPVLSANTSRLEKEPVAPRTQKRKVRTLTSLLNESGIKQFDLLSINASEENLEVLKGLDLNRFRPSLIIIKDESRKKEISDYIQPAGYHLIHDTGNYLFFSFRTKGAQTYTPPDNSRNFDLVKPKKIIGLVSTRNDGIRLHNLLNTLSRFVDSMVVFDDNSIDDTPKILSDAQKSGIIEAIISGRSDPLDDVVKRNQLLKKGRQLGGTHFLVIDADEILTANLINEDILRKSILELEEGDSIVLKRIRLWKSPNNYRFDETTEAWNFKTLVFADDSRVQYSGEVTENSVVPKELHGKRYVIEGSQYGVLQFEFADWNNMLIHQAWQLMHEKIRKPQRFPQEINQRYAVRYADTNIEVKELLPEWLDGYENFDPSVYSTVDVPRISQILSWLNEYDDTFFAGLEINRLNWSELQKQYSPYPGTSEQSDRVNENNSAKSANLNDLLDQAVDYLHQKLPAEAEECLRTILGAEPQNLAALNNLAVVKIMQEEFEAAQIILDRILQIHPEDENARENLYFLRKVRKF